MGADKRQPGNPNPSPHPEYDVLHMRYGHTQTRISCRRGSRMPAVVLCCAVWHATCGTRRLRQAAPKQSPMPSEILSDFSRIMRAQRRQPATTKGATTTATTSRRRTTGISLSAHLHTLYARVQKCTRSGVDRVVFLG